MIDIVLRIASIIVAAGTIIGLAVAVIKWYLKQEQQSTDIRQLKEENTLICFVLSACLDGLLQLGCNHTVPIAKDKLDKYLNQTAHK